MIADAVSEDAPESNDEFRDTSPDEPAIAKERLTADNLCKEGSTRKLWGMLL